MRISLRIAIVLVIFSGHALAKGKKVAPGKHSGKTMDSNDPVEKEKSDEGPFAPKGKTGELKQEEEKHEEEQRVAALPPVKPPPRDKVGVFGNVLIGFGKAPEPGPGANVATGKTTAATFMVGGHYDVSSDLTFGVRVPWTVGSARQNDGSDQSSQALGAVELMGEDRVTLSPHTHLPIDFGLGIPVAQGNYDDAGANLRRAQLNDFADAASGYRDPELFGPKRLPIIVGVSISYQRQALDLHALTKFVAGIKVGGTYANANDPVGTYQLESVSFHNVTSAGIAYQFLENPGLFAGLDSWIAYNAINDVEFTSNTGAAGPTRIQLVFEPHVGAHFGKISPSVGYVFPIGGRLADTSTSGLELHCDVGF